MTLTQDNKSTNTLTQDNRSSVATMTQDNKSKDGALWSSTMYPWKLDLPWLWKGNGQQITLDIRH